MTRTLSDVDRSRRNANRRRLFYQSNHMPSGLYDLVAGTSTSRALFVRSLVSLSSLLNALNAGEDASLIIMKQNASEDMTGMPI
jgi:hypothetical protein